MRERAQASVEAIALTAAVMALAGALALGAVRLGPPLAATIAAAFAGAFGGQTPTAPGLDPLERLLLASATGTDTGGATLLDLRTSLRARLGRSGGDDAFAATLRPLVVSALSAQSVAGTPGSIRVVDRDAEDSWLRARFRPGIFDRFKQAAATAIGKAGTIVGLVHHLGFGSRAAEQIEPGQAAGDIVVAVDDGARELVLRRRPGTGLTVIAKQGRLSITGETGR